MHNARRSGGPGTVGIVVAIVIGFLISFFTNGQTLVPNLAFLPFDAWARPWTFATFPYAYGPRDLVAVLFLCLWLWGIGMSVERELGTPRFVGFWFTMTILGALCLWIGSKITGQIQPLTGAFMPVSAVTVAWGTRNPTAEVRLMFVLPILGKWLAWLSVILVFFGTSPQLAPFAAVPLGLAYLFAADKLAFLPWSAGKRAKRDKKADKKVYDLIDRAETRKKERDEKERLRKLFESSLSDDEK